MSLRDKSCDRVAEVYRLAAFARQIIGSHVQAVRKFSSDSGPEADSGRGCFNLADGAKQVAFRRVHLVAVERVVDLHETAEDAPLVKHSCDLSEAVSFAGKGDGVGAVVCSHDDLTRIVGGDLLSLWSAQAGGKHSPGIGYRAHGPAAMKDHPRGFA